MVAHDGERGPFRSANQQYRQRGWLGTIPLPKGKKHPPPKGWTGRNAQHPSDEQISEWCETGRFDKHDVGNIALHLGPTPDGKHEVIGIDVDDYGDKHGGKELEELEAKNGPLPATYISTSRALPSGIRFYRVPVGYAFIGKAANGIDIIQRAHRYAVVWPSWNPDSQARYGWLDADGREIAAPEGLPNVGRLPILSPHSPKTRKWFDYLTRGGVKDQGQPMDMDSTNDEIKDWALATLPGGEDTPPCKRMQKALGKWLSRITDEESTHDKITGAQWELVNLAVEGHAGWYVACTAAGNTSAHNTIQVRGKRGISELRGELGRGLWGALRSAKGTLDEGHALPPRCLCGDEDAQRLIKEAFAEGGAWRLGVSRPWEDFGQEEFWSVRPELARLREFAQARGAGPWSTLGAVLARAIATIPPNVVLPPTIGGEASVNLFVALVAESGWGKGASETAAKAFLDTAVDPFEATLGSGEGLLKQYAYKRRVKGQEPEQVNLRNAVAFTAPEIDTVAALSGRSGSTLMPELRKAWMGERLGFGWSDTEKAVALMAHRYRMTMIVGVQPGCGGTLLKDADGGTPQRFVWLSTADPNAPEEDDRPEEPLPLRLPAWPVASEPDEGVSEDEDASESVEESGGVRLKFANVKDGYELDKPVPRHRFHVLGIPPGVAVAIRAEQRAKLRGESTISALDSHAMLARLKIAVGFMWLNGRTDKVNEEDWALAGTVLAVSNATRDKVRSALNLNTTKAAEAAGRRDAEREVVKEDLLRDKKIARIIERIRTKLRADNNQGKAKLKRQFGPDKDFFDEALTRLVDVGDVDLKPIEYNGRPGHAVCLKEGR
ncbi:bifunctional DNA primase/polymerase [Mycolicibacterium brisbanense]|uniref:DNA primase/polymerase bifunctional N-terminal domain-containing protein n=1 Tax=Mycolicibacterium brisbanense TaxID=146020 RepID=A0A100W0H7_9MYCO|nr:bifunctional DNA primase/polymerase [Mycolicibacterium brisbanense]MCV7161866.1 bifunctional DNA primase/polymerase [Mycolicibacterium brisbanense]GAS89379.1 uncharacterized protein RMCB_3475 [Mycolicibacterium brisbanense]